MNIKKQKIPNGGPKIKPVASDTNILYFSFHAISRCKKSNKKLSKGNQKLCNRFIQKMFEITKYVDQVDSPFPLHYNNPADYKKVENNIKGYEYKYKIDQDNSVLVSPYEISSKELVLRLGKVGNYH